MKIRAYSTIQNRGDGIAERCHQDDEDGVGGAESDNKYACNGLPSVDRPQIAEPVCHK